MIARMKKKVGQGRDRNGELRSARCEWALVNHVTEWYCDRHKRSVLEGRTTLLLINVGGPSPSTPRTSVDVLQAVTVLTKALVGAEAKSSWHTALQHEVIQPGGRRRIVLGMQSGRVGNDRRAVHARREAIEWRAVVVVD